MIENGATVKAYDPEAMNEAKRIYSSTPGFILCETQNDALEGANALCVITEWKNFWSPDFEELKTKISDKVIFDGRNLYDPNLLKNLGLVYYGIGRK